MTDRDLLCLSMLASVQEKHRLGSPAPHTDTEAARAVANRLRGVPDVLTFEEQNMLDWVLRERAYALADGKILPPQNTVETGPFR